MQCRSSDGKRNIRAAKASCGEGVESLISQPPRVLARCAEFVVLVTISTASLGSASFAAGSPGADEPAAHRAHSPPASPAPSSPDGFSAGRGWKINLGRAYSDTFSFRSEDVLPAAAEALAHDRWRIRSADPVTGRIVTEWQPVRHLFVRLFLGEVRERCVVDVTPLGERRSLVKFRAALCTRKNIARNPLMPRVRKEYEKAVRDWQREVRATLVERARKR